MDGQKGHSLDVDAKELQHKHGQNPTLKLLWVKAPSDDNTEFRVEDHLLWQKTTDRFVMRQHNCAYLNDRSMVLALAHQLGHPGRDMHNKS